MKINLNLTAPENCPSFEKCQKNDCPLIEKPNNYKDYPEDKLLFNFHKCRCSKLKRMDIAKAFSLKSLGLTLKELSNMKKSLKMKKEVKFTGDKNESIENSPIVETSEVKND